jgi:hypothetical protein
MRRSVAIRCQWPHSSHRVCIFRWGTAAPSHCAPLTRTPAARDREGRRRIGLAWAKFRTRSAISPVPKPAAPQLQKQKAHCCAWASGSTVCDVAAPQRGRPALRTTGFKLTLTWCSRQAHGTRPPPGAKDRGPAHRTADRRRPRRLNGPRTWLQPCNVPQQDEGRRLRRAKGRERGGGRE